ncbi:MAG: L,D-transpeptidase/peptidoglycan binding protein [Coriobacteriia bacterium]|nr:L,D-transpeptidase/peptidoglycan binding protein [Coriobacteriia bacterium]
MSLKTRALRFLGVLAASTLVALSAGFTWAAVDDYAVRDVVPPGVTVEGIPLQGLSRAEARKTIETAIAQPLLEPVEVTFEDQVFTLDPGESLHVDVDAMLEHAFEPLTGTTVAERVARRMLEEPIHIDVETMLVLDGAPLETWVADVAEQVDRASIDATFTRDPIEDAIVMRKSRIGYRTDREETHRLLTDALLAGEKSVELPVEIVQPEVSSDSLGKTIVVDLSERRLYLYEGLEVEKEYGVAVGTPGHSTPRGSWQIVNKRYMPSWSNPGSAWAADMPDYIPPGVSNPLGTRALDLNASAIRIHGTTKNYSIGTAASHGCMRMHRWDVEDLFERVEVGTPVLIIG